MPLAVLTIVSALRQGYLLSAGTFGVASASWSVFALYSAWKFSRRQETDKPHRTAEETPRHRRWMGFVKTTCLLILSVVVIRLVTVMVYGSPLHSALAALWWIIVYGSEFIFVSLLTDESVYNR